MYYVHYKNRFRSYVQTFAFLERASARIFVSALLPSLGENGFSNFFNVFPAGGGSLILAFFFWPHSWQSQQTEANRKSTLS
jgi:hypothetical protein